MALMATSTCQFKNKWKSQKIQKQFKNKRHSDVEEWSTWSHSKNSLTNYCNEYHKNIKDHKKTLHELDVKYKRCDVCTYDNKYCDSYCSICESLLNNKISNKSTSTRTHYNHASDHITFGQYLPSHLNDIINVEDDMDESIQIAIISSLKSNQNIKNKTNYENENIYNQSYDLYSHNYEYPKIRIKLKKDYRKERREKERQIAEKRIEKEKKIAEAKHKKEQQLKIKEEKRKQKEAEQRQKFINNAMKTCPKLKSLITDNNIGNSITKSIKKSYNLCHKKFEMKWILNDKILQRFMSLSFELDDCKNDYEIVYHGTNSYNNQSIIKKGLLIGGTKGVSIAHGSCYGKGIYCSPYSQTAKGYECGSMFVCIVKNSGNNINKNGAIWVVANECDIVPLYLASFEDIQYRQPPPPPPPLPPVSVQPIKETDDDEIKIDPLCQQIMKFIPSFQLLNKNCKQIINRKIRRKWSAYHKISVYE